ncbi:hypothetical protein B0T13DRAFT_445928 [Neurospora crassa]|nr:hypothetical protein B0T13DRAFT_445928 [Neurospora crassa]
MRPFRRTVLVLYMFCACCVNRSSAVQETVEARVLVTYGGKLKQCKVKVEYGFRVRFKGSRSSTPWRHDRNKSGHPAKNDDDIQKQFGAMVYGEQHETKLSTMRARAELMPTPVEILAKFLC